MSHIDRARLRQQLIADEGCVLHAYTDSLGFWTIGIGRLIDSRKGGGITPEEAAYLLDHDIDRAVHRVASALPWVSELDEVRQAVLVMMAFQMGVNGLLSFKRTLATIYRGEWQTASVQMLESKWARQTPERAGRLSAMMRTGEWGTP